MTTLEHLRVINRTCPRPNCGGYVATKNGGSKRCPFCNPARAQPTDWGYIGIGAAIVIVLALATPILRAWASLGWG